VAELKAAQPLRMPGIDDPRTPYGLIRAVADCLDDEATITTDVGQHQMWVAQAYPLRRPRQWLTSGGLGTMGFGMPAAIGAALAEPERTVVCFTGDGSILMNIQELVHGRRGERQRQDRADEQLLAGPGVPAADDVLRRADLRLEIQGHA
jgi:acetolactate synthase-1/2/3 large subunit